MKDWRSGLVAVGLATLVLGGGVLGCDEGKKDEDKAEKDDDKSDKKKKKKADKKKDDGDTKAAATSEPSSTAAPVPEAPTAEASADSGGNAPEPPKCGPPDKIPAIPEGSSDAPKDLAEWNTGCEVNTQGPNSQAPDCTSVLVREWLKVTCKGDMLGYEEMDGFGAEGADYFKLFTPNQLISFVVRLKKGKSQKVRMCRPKERASLFVSWPPGKDQPTIIAVGIGPKCDKF
jgi:hypothetical protein